MLAKSERSTVISQRGTLDLRLIGFLSMALDRSQKRVKQEGDQVTFRTSTTQASCPMTMSGPIKQTSEQTDWRK